MERIMGVMADWDRILYVIFIRTATVCFTTTSIKFNVFNHRGIRYSLIFPHINAMGIAIYKNVFTFLMFFIVLIIPPRVWFYHFKKVSPLRSISTRPVTPYLKIKPGLSRLINTSEPNYPFSGFYVHEAKALCTSATNITLLIIILSSTKNFHWRRAVRQTWTNEKYYRLYGVVKTIFLLGTVENIAVQKKIDKESKQFGDIVQGDFIDNYHNLTYKSTMGFRWATENCRNAKYVLKTDDDVFINLFILFQNNTFNESEDNFHVFCYRQSHYIERDVNSKWYVDKNQFKGFDMYPTYCGGSFVLMSNKVVPYFYESLKRTPFFWVEDALLYGIGLANLHGIIYKKLTDDQRDVDESDFTMKCLNERLKQCPIFITLTYSDWQMQDLWAKTIKIYSD